MPHLAFQVLVCLRATSRSSDVFSVVYFSRETLPQKRNGKRALLGDLDFVHKAAPIKGAEPKQRRFINLAVPSDVEETAGKTPCVFVSKKNGVQRALSF